MFGSMYSARSMWKITCYLVVFITFVDAVDISSSDNKLAVSSSIIKPEYDSLSEQKPKLVPDHNTEEVNEQPSVNTDKKYSEDVIDNDVDEGSLKENKYQGIGTRQPKQVAETPCFTSDSNSTRGTCVHPQTCTKVGGVAGGKCPVNGFVCCSTEKTCHDVTNTNNTKFINPGYPKADSGTGACSLTINRFNDNVCQLRFDFLTLELSQPDANGNCVTDFLTVTQGTYAAPIICGLNSGQHMYVDVDPLGGAVRITVDRTAASMSNRMWNIEVSQIECTSKYRAPSGCLQYYTETSGTVDSFNFKQDIDESSVPQTTRQIVDMSYAVCIKAADGYCSVMWTRNITGGDHAFTVSSNIAAMADSLIGDPAASTIGGRCTTDYVVIPGGVNDKGTKNDRYCGAGFPNWIITNMRPFIMFVKTDNDEKFDVLNRGFSLDYRQMIC